MKPSGDSTTATSEPQARVRRIARKLATAQAATSASPLGLRGRAEHRRDAGEPPLLAEEEQQTCGGEHDQGRLGVRERQHEAAGEHGEQHHRPRGDAHAVQLPGEEADQQHRDGAEHEVQR